VNKLKLDMIGVIKEITPSLYGDIFLKQAKTQIKISYKARRSPTILVLPKKVELDELFWECIGLLRGEMSKTKEWSFEFVNSEPLIIAHILKFLKRFKIKLSDLKVRIQYSSVGLSQRQKEKIENYVNHFGVSIRVSF